MKKFTVLSAIVGMIVVAVLFFTKNEKAKFSQCVLSNVEALAQNPEDAGETWQKCKMTETFTETNTNSDWGGEISTTIGPAGGKVTYDNPTKTQTKETTVESFCCKKNGDLYDCKFDPCPDVSNNNNQADNSNKSSNNNKNGNSKKKK